MINQFSENYSERNLTNNFIILLPTSLDFLENKISHDRQLTQFSSLKKKKVV